MNGVLKRELRTFTDQFPAQQRVSSMPIALTCPCGRKLNLDDSLAGRHIRCPSCTGTLRVPETVDDIVIATPARQPSPLPRPPSLPTAELVQARPPAEPRPAAAPPAQAKTPAAPPPLPNAPKPIQQPVAPTSASAPQHVEEDIPEFSEIEVMEDTDKPLPVEPATMVRAIKDDPWETMKAAPEQIAAPQDDGDAWEEVRLRDLAPTTVGDPVGESAQNDSETYGLAADTGTGVRLSSTGALSHLRLDVDRITSLAYGSNHQVHLAAGDDELLCLDFGKRDWSYLRRAHSASIHRLAVSSDCRLALSGDEEGNLMLWDLARRESLRWLDGHRSGVTAVAFSPDGRYAASGGIGGAVRLWKVATGERISLEQGQLEQVVNCLCFSQDGTLLVAVGSKGRAKLWSMADRRLEVRLETGAAHLRSVAFSPDGQSILACSGRRMKVCKWDVDTGARQPAFMGFSSKHRRVTGTWLGANGTCFLAIGFTILPGQRYQMDSLTASTYVESALLRASIESKLYNTHLNPGSGHAVYHLEIWDAAYERALSKAPLGPLLPEAVACSPDAHRALVGFRDGVVMLVAL